MTKTEENIKKKKKNKNYFRKEHQEAIVKYANCNNIEVRNKLYNEVISPVFKELIDKVSHKYKFTSLPNVSGLKADCEVYLITILSNFDPNKGHKAFSYFTVVTKHWFFHKTKKNAKEQALMKKQEDISGYAEAEFLSESNPYHKNRELREYVEGLKEEMAYWSRCDLKPNERKVLEAIKILLDDPESIDIFNKKAIYLYIRELTGLNTKQVLNSLGKFRKRYSTFKRTWIGK